MNWLLIQTKNFKFQKKFYLQKKTNLIFIQRLPEKKTEKKNQLFYNNFNLKKNDDHHHYYNHKDLCSLDFSQNCLFFVLFLFPTDDGTTKKKKKKKIYRNKVCANINKRERMCLERERKRILQNPK